MINNINELRQLAVRMILRQAPLDYLLRHSLGKPWVESTDLNEMAWTDSKKLFFNFPLLQSRLQERNHEKKLKSQPELDPGEIVQAFMAALAHECLHVLWLHKYRSKDKQMDIWEVACEYAINYEISQLIGIGWIKDLDVCYPSETLLAELGAKGLLPTTDGFYEAMLDPKHAPMLKNIGVECTFCDRHSSSADEMTTEEIISAVSQTMINDDERAEILEFLVAQQARPQKVPWEMLLLGGIEDAMSQEQTWTTPSRRNDLLPGWRHEKLLSFVWILDVSPSIDDKIKHSFIQTLQTGINLYHDSQHRVIFFADSVVEDIVVSSGTNLSQMQVPCGNGTDLTDVWEILEKDKPEYALVLTDLELSPVPKPTLTKIIWGIVGEYRAFDPDYGIKVVLK